VEIAEGVEGLCHVSEAVDANGAPVKLDLDTEHEFKIVKMNQEEKKVGLSIKAIGEEASRAEVESYKERERGGEKEHKEHKGSSSSSSSSSTTLGDLINWKRSERE
jgi:small subunit ribosomal protein S1